MLTRREFLEVGATAGTAIALAPYGCAGERSAPGVVVNDIHSQLNATRVHRVVKPPSVDAVVQLVQSARQEGRPLSIAGGRHAMGGQQFGRETTLVDMGAVNPGLAIGGYGLFGVVTSVRLRLAPRVKVQREVQILEIDDLMPAFARRIAAGFTYGDFQYHTDPDSPDFLRKGVFSCYRPVAASTPIQEKQKELSADDWNELIYLAHADRTRAFQAYSRYYLSTSGQVYWSDTHQLGPYLDDYHRALDHRLGASEPATELITEIYAPRDALARFLTDVRDRFRAQRTPLIYGTIRLIERDDETFLAWAKQPYACVIFNLHVVHSPAGLERAAAEFRQLIDAGIRYGGGYYLTHPPVAARPQGGGGVPPLPRVFPPQRGPAPPPRIPNERDPPP